MTGIAVFKINAQVTLKLLMWLQKVLQGDGDTGEELLRDGPEFERWIKLGLSSTDNPPDTNTES